MSEDAAAAAATLIEAAGGTGAVGYAELTAALARLGVTGDEGTRLAGTVDRLRREQDRLRRREHELAALFSSARELAELRDTDALLQRLVRRAHEMMGGDVTYLSEFDPETRELRVRVTDGSVSAQFQRLRVPPGRGLASVIVETRTPQWLSRYQVYRADRHEPSIDAAVAAEGIVSILGVPMLSGDEVLGVLFVANREEYEFAPEETALLSALADHAAVVLHTAQSLRRLQHSEDEARRALDRLTGHLAERDRANTVHQQLVRAVLAGGGFAPVAETLATALGRPVMIIDDRDQVLAADGPAPPADDPLNRVDEPTRAAIEDSRRSGHCVAVGGRDGREGSDGSRTVAALSAGRRYFGAILLGEGEFGLGPVDRRTVERAAQVGALLALQQEAGAEAERRVRSEVVADLLAAAPERYADVERRARRLGVVPADLDALILFAVPGEHRGTAVRTLGPLCGDRALVGEHRGFVVAAYPAARLAIEPEELRVRVGQAIQAPVLAVPTAVSAGALPAAVAVALRTARLLAALGIEDGTASTDDYLPYSALLDTDATALNAFLDETIGPIRRYDSARGTDLLGTLRAFVRSNASPTRTARALSFHPNTILQRLDRLDQLLGRTWRDDERLFRIGIAARLDELRERLSARSNAPPKSEPTG
ncbi:helix-turn-helix domain-containing protein [Microlunatus sp. GCM10028923]|uniref:helix-turn-helix domain-containing protein n=1 Tax=Microlunatus sp. GCM10028923 TaxID=3273400 RepID=UPI00360BB6FE